MIQSAFLLLTVIACMWVPDFDRVPLLKSDTQTALSIPEPSDIAFENDQYYIVSDRGILYKTDLNGKILAKSSYQGVDYESVCIAGSAVIVIDERVRMVHYFDKQTLQHIRSISVPYNAAANRGVEGILYVPETKLFYLFTEKDPSMCFIYDENWQQKDNIILDGVADISAACYYKNTIWLLSDEESAIFTYDPVQHKLEKKYRLNLINPEGICVVSSGTLTVCSDDMQKLFNYKSWQ
jgi:uncharacterized protein YjiK